MDLSGLRSGLEEMWQLSARKIRAVEESYDQSAGSPVFTVDGRYTTRGWTEWTEGFLYGSSLLQFDATGDRWFLEYARNRTLERMARHVTHVGVHDHGFNNVSTYGNLLRLSREEKLEAAASEAQLFELALKASGAVQASRWTAISGGSGYIYSFNGPHSLFIDTIRSLRSLALAHQLGHVLLAENDRVISLLRRLVLHAVTTARFNVYYGTGRDIYDVRGRVAHESIFNVTDGSYRCPSTQQGYSPFTTWTRGLAWAILGYAEQLEFLDAVDAADFERDLSDLPSIANGLAGAAGAPTSYSMPGTADTPKELAVRIMVDAATATADYYIENSCADGIPYWDTGAPGLASLGDWRAGRADPFNDWEPVDSSAAVIAAQGLLRLAEFLSARGDEPAAARYRAAGATTLSTLLEEPYLSTSDEHQGLLLHALYHRPNGWDKVPYGARIPSGESCMWGDYHLRELALYVQRLLGGGPHLTFFLKEKSE